MRAENLSKWYGQVIGLNDITHHHRRRRHGLLGPNGAGKSTLLKLITGQLKPNKGTVKILGEPVWGNPGIFRRMGVCPEQDAFYDRMTGHEWVTALLRLHGFGDREAADTAMAALEQVDLQGRRQQAHRRLQQGHAPARQARAGARARARAARPRRAAVGHGSARAAKDDSAAPQLGRAGAQRHRLEPHPSRSRGADVGHPADAPRARARRRQRAPDSRSHRRASAHGLPAIEAAPRARDDARRRTRTC